MRFPSSLTLALAASLAAPLAGHTQNIEPARHQRMMVPGQPPFLQGVNLSETQQDRVFALVHAQQPQLREQHKAARKAHDELRALSMSGRFDENQAAALARAAGQALSAETLLRARTDAQIMALLTPEQREQAANDRPRHPPRP